MSRSLNSQRTPNTKGRHILIVDDEPTLRLGFAYALSDETTTADTASNGAEALERLDKFAYDAVVLDLRMPEIDGLAVIRRMRSKGLKTPVILCSAFITLHSALLAIENQVVDFIMKPVRPQELRRALSVVLGDDDSRLGNALGALRRAELDKAIGILEMCGSDAGESERAWMKVLSTFKEHRFDVKDTEPQLDDHLIDYLVVQSGH